MIRSRAGQLLAQPDSQVRAFDIGVRVLAPLAQMPVAQPQAAMRNRPLGAHPADRLLGSCMALQTRCGGEKCGLADAALSFARKLLQML